MRDEPEIFHPGRRVVLPVAGSVITGYTGKLSWWRRALFWLATRKLRRGPGNAGAFVFKEPFSDVVMHLSGKPDLRTPRQMAATGIGEG